MKWRLREYVDKNNDTLEKLAEYLEISYQTLSKKMNEKTDFTRGELIKIRDRYNMSPEEVCRVFF